MSVTLISERNARRYLDDKLSEAKTNGISDALRKVDNLKQDADRAIEVIGALRAGRFYFITQPIFDSTADEVHFEEILLRLFDNSEQEMPIFESLMCLDRWSLLAEVTPYLITLQLEHSQEMPQSASVNVPPSILLPSEPRQQLLFALEEFAAKADPSQVVLEITETAYLEPHQELIDFMCQVSDMGYRWALDDFGDGFHTFEHIEQLPVSYIKLAKAISQQLLLSSEVSPEVTEMIELCRELNIPLVAEHVPDEDAARKILDWHGVQFAQMLALRR